MGSFRRPYFFLKKDTTIFDFQFRNEEIPPLELDREQIKRVIINLLDNAVAAVSENGEIRIATSHDRSRGVV